MLIAPTAKDPVVLSYLALRKAVGVVALGLPFVLVITWWTLRNQVESSISNYYYTGMRNLFIGSLLPRLRRKRRDRRNSFFSVCPWRGVFSNISGRRRHKASASNRNCALYLCRAPVFDFGIFLSRAFQDDGEEQATDPKEAPAEQGLYGLWVCDHRLHTPDRGLKSLQHFAFDWKHRPGLLFRDDRADRFRNRLAHKGRNVPKR